MQEHLKCYAVGFRRPRVSQPATYFIISETLESAIEPAKDAMAREYGSEAAENAEIESINEIARGVILPVKKARGASAQ